MTGQILAVIPWAAMLLPMILALRATGSDPARQHLTVSIPVDRRAVGTRQGR
jgi:hypothetical protein